MDESAIQSYLTSKHKALINNPLHSDVILLVGKDRQEIHANKHILAHFSPYYLSAFKEDWKQNKTEDQRQQILDHSEIIEKPTMMLILEYMYASSVKGICGGSVSKVYLAADFLQLDHLMQVCEGRMNEWNVFEMFNSGLALQQFSFVQACIEVLKEVLPVLEPK